MSEAKLYTHTIRAGSVKENDEQLAQNMLLSDNLWRGQDWRLLSLCGKSVSVSAGSTHF